jgi:hypothetical protein
LTSSHIWAHIHDEGAITLQDCGARVSDASSSKSGDISGVSSGGGDSTVILGLGPNEGTGAGGSNINVVGCTSRKSEDEFWPPSGRESDLFEVGDISKVISVVLSK